MDNSGISDDQQHKKGRHRKKQLYNSILQQMEFYFSDSNLAKDRFMSQLLLNDPYIELSTFIKFNKIRKLTLSTDDLAKAISKSEVLQLSEDKSKVCRKTPVQEKENVDECTIYVENIKSDATHDWLKSVFSEFGNVAYISIPKYKNNNLNKGFAFIEFENEEDANKTLQFFEKIGCGMQSHIVPDQLLSIVTFEGKEEDSQTDNSHKKIVDEEALNADEEEMKKEDYDPEPVQANQSDVTEETLGKKRKANDNEVSTESKKIKLSANEEKDVEAATNDAEDKKKKKRLQKRKAHFKEIGLQILSKKEWKKMRNKYLNMQREKMKALKAHLYKKRFSTAIEKSKEKLESPAAMDAEDNLKDKKSIEFVPGVIVKLILEDSVCDSKKLKADLKNCAEGVQYVDLSKNPSEPVYLRFTDNEGAKQFVSGAFKGEKSLLEGAQEKEYWDKIKSDMELKTSKDKKKQRGRTKLLKRAERELGKHIRFDDSE